MKTLNSTINYEKNMEPEFTAPLRFIPDPTFEATVRQMQYYYQVCQLLLDEGTFTHASRLYIRDLVIRVDEMQQKYNPTTAEVNEYLQRIATLCYEIGLTTEQVQKAGVPVY